MAAIEPQNGDSEKMKFPSELPLLPNGGIDLYALIHTKPTESQAAIRARIGEMYNEALANTEHKDLRKRFYYESLLDTLPRCHEILLSDDRRPLYDDYRRKALAGEEVPEFADFLRDTAANLAEKAREQQGLLEIREHQPEENSSLPPAPPTQDAGRPQTSGSLTAALGLGIGFAALIISRGVLRMPLATSVMLGLVSAVVVAVLFSTLTSRSRK